MQQRFLLLKLFAALLISALLCTGCGGSSSPDNTISGAVADGYLSGARVFLDLNDNRFWDPDEPYAISGADGTYTISDIAVEDYYSYPVVAEVTVTTIDHDTRKPVSLPYTLVAPAGHPEFISPLTTMVQVSYESNPDITLDEAHAAVKEMLSMGEEESVDLFSDYVEKEIPEDATGADYAKLHNIAQLSARIMGANVEVIESAAGDASIALDGAKDEILRMAVKEIMQSMDLIEDVATDETSFDADQGVQALAIEVDTSDIATEIASEVAAKEFQVPSLRWATIFRDHHSSGSDDFLCMALEQDLDLAGYAFTIEGPGGTEYTLEEADLYDDPNAPVAWWKSLGNAPEGEYTFNITLPGGDKIEVAKDTHVHTDIPALDPATAEVVNVNGADSRVYYDLLDGTYYYRLAIKDAATGQIVYRTKRRERNIQYFPPEYSTGGYEYRIEAWDSPLLKDATARFRTTWETINASGVTTSTYVEFFKGYRRIRIKEDGTPSERVVLQIGITNPSDLEALTLSGPGGFNYTFDLALTPGEFEEDLGATYFLRGSGTTQEGNEYADYFLIVYGTPASGVYTWSADTTSGGIADISRRVTIYDPTVLPGVDPSSVAATEDPYGDITFKWGAVTHPADGAIFYRVAIVKGDDWDNGYYALRVPKNSWKGNRADIETVIGGSLDEGDAIVSIWVIDSQYASTIRNRTDFAPVNLIIN